MEQRAIVIVLDSLGVGALPDAAAFGDEGSNTLKHILERMPGLRVPNLRALGLGLLMGAQDAVRADAGYGKMRERSCGKDTTTGHWEMSGVILDKPFPTFPNGFPKAFLDEFSARTRRPVIGNCTASGTEIIQRLGKQAVEEGALIVYTSADSVFQIAAHEDLVPVEQLYQYCETARKILHGRHSVGRVIARPFTGEEGNFVRTPRRHDFSMEPPSVTMLDQLKEAGKDVIAVGKIRDIFAGRGITEAVSTSGNEEGIQRTVEYLDRDFEGLCFVNLVDFDMLYGHRRDVDGYARALSYFDGKLPEIMGKMREEDILMITADHGCDPAYTATTDHTREYTPFLMYTPSKRNFPPENFGTFLSFARIGATVLQYFNIVPKFENP